MIIQIDKNVTVVQSGDLVIVTRPCIMGGVASHAIQSPYTALEIAYWLQDRLSHRRNALAQEAFPAMKAEDREFLMSGITPDHWNKMFPKDLERKA
jgi:hypothetical protein